MVTGQEPRTTERQHYGHHPRNDNVGWLFAVAVAGCSCCSRARCPPRTITPSKLDGELSSSESLQRAVFFFFFWRTDVTLSRRISVERRWEVAAAGERKLNCILKFLDNPATTLWFDCSSQSVSQSVSGERTDPVHLMAPRGRTRDV